MVLYGNLCCKINQNTIFVSILTDNPYLQKHTHHYIARNRLWCSSTVNKTYGSGHETVAVLLPGFYQLIAKPGNKTATVSWPDPYIFWLTFNLNSFGGYL